MGCRSLQPTLCVPQNPYKSRDFAAKLMLWRKVNLILKLYYTPISLNSRRVWVALLEKEIAFEPLALNLDGDQFKPDFLPINLFHRIPVLVKEDLTVVESLAILDDREAKYSTPALSIPAETYL